MPALLTTGKGVYIWKPANIFGGNPRLIADELVRAKVDFVAIKLHNGTYAYDGLEEVILEIRSRGIRVGGWGYIYLKYNALGEALTAVKVCNKYKPDFYLIDAEGEASGQWLAATVFAKALRLGLPDMPIGLNSFWKPSYHKDIPFKQLRSICDFDCPQVYWRGYNPVGKLQASQSEYATMTPHLPFAMVAGDMYYEAGVKPTPAQVKQFIDAALGDPQIQAVVMWSMDQMKVTPELWAVFAGYEVDPEDADAPQTGALYSAVVNTYGLNVRSLPSTSGKILTALRQGDRVDVYTLVNDWAAITPQYNRWVYAYYLKRL